MLLLILAVSLAVSCASNCPEQCHCKPGSLLDLTCSVGPNKVFFKATIIHSISIYCEGTSFTCGDLPKMNFGNDQPLSSVSIESCSPSILPCINEVLRTSSVTSLTLTTGVAPLEGRHVSRLGNVTEVIIMGGVDKTIPVSIINSLPTLKKLRISGTDVTLKTKDFLNITTQLERLELYGAINEIPEDAFNGLSKLLILDIWGNNISDIGEHSFRGLDSLDGLILNNSCISNIAAESFIYVPNVRSISLSGNQLKELPPLLFSNLKLLKHVYIHNNDVPLKLNKHTFVNLPTLQYFFITNSSSNLPDQLLIKCRELRTIDLSGNLITSLSSTVFEDFEKMENLDLSRNKIGKLSSRAFSFLKQLTYLNLDRNNLRILPGFLFSRLLNLKYLSVDHNLLRDFSRYTFDGAYEFETISMRSNKLTFGNKRVSPFKWMLGLKNLYLSGNEISTIFPDWKYELKYLTELDLSRNNFTVLNNIDCQFYHDVIVDLRYNHITTLKLNVATVSKDDPPYKTSWKYILLNNNPLACDCRLYNLTLRLTGPTTEEPTFVVNNAKCASPLHLKGQLFKNVSPNDLKCDLPSEHCFENCSSCQSRPAKNDLVYDCQTLPKALANPANFGLKYLTLRLRTAPENIANLHLELLNLSNIGISQIPFPPSKTVKAIDLSNNELTKIPMEFLKLNITLYLSNNPFECDCWHSEELALLKASRIVKDIGLIRCGEKLLTSMDPLELCNYLKAAAVAGVTFIILVLILAIITVIIYKKYQEIIAFIIVKGLCPCCFVENSDDKEYDVFVSYAHKDKKYLDELLPKLENEFGLKTCVHYRDWYVGDFIPNQINRSVEKSRKTVIILSNNFLDSGYANMEFRAAHNIALREGKNRIILILLEDVMKNQKLSDELKTHLKMNTFLKWNDARFSERLQKALPLRDNKKFVWPKVFSRGTRNQTVDIELVVQPNSNGEELVT